MGRRMKMLARRSSTKMKKKRNRLRRRDNDALRASAQRQAKMLVIKRSLISDVNYKELPIAKRIQIDQRIVSKKRKIIDKITKKLLRQLKQKEGQRIKQNRSHKQTQWEIDMKTFSEARGDTAVFTFGRFNPPTTGHEKLINALAREVVLVNQCMCIHLIPRTQRKTHFLMRRRLRI